MPGWSSIHIERPFPNRTKRSLIVARTIAMIACALESTAIGVARSHTVKASGKLA
jgi:hypothetical protein